VVVKFPPTIAACKEAPPLLLVTGKCIGLRKRISLKTRILLRMIAVGFIISKMT